MLVFFPWDLNKLRLEVVYSILHLLKVLLHPFVLTVIVIVDLTSDYLRVVIYDTFSSPSRLWSTTPAPPACLLDDPFMWILHCGLFLTPLAFHMGELYNEVSNNLPLYCLTRVILYIEFGQLKYP